MTPRIAEGKETFRFEGHEILVPYAKYLVEYLDSQFALEKNKWDEAPPRLGTSKDP